MTKKRPIAFAEFRSVLEELEYVEKRVPRGRLFEHPEEGLLLFRAYRDGEPVLPRDLQSTRTFLDPRGIIEADDFDAHLLRSETPV